MDPVSYAYRTVIPLACVACLFSKEGKGESFLSIPNFPLPLID